MDFRQRRFFTFSKKNNKSLIYSKITDFLKNLRLRKMNKTLIITGLYGFPFRHYLGDTTGGTTFEHGYLSKSDGIPGFPVGGRFTQGTDMTSTFCDRRSPGPGSGRPGR